MSAPDSSLEGPSIRRQLLLLALFPLGIVLPVLLLILTQWGSDYLDRLLVAKVGADLSVASNYFERVSGEIGNSVAHLATSARLAHAFEKIPRAQHAQRHAWLEAEQQRLKLDFLYWLTPQGCHAQRPGKAPECLTHKPVIARAAAGSASTETEVFSESELFEFHPELAQRAHTPILPTLNAATDPRQAETRGLVVHTAAPIRDEHGALIGILAGGVLLNGNLAFVDQLNEIVYPEDSLPFGSVGTATLFLGDVRIATNVRLFAGERAIGTRVSQTVRDTVLGEGKIWLDRAFVVQDWYFSGYRPLLDGHGQRIGMLYVGFLETPFAAAKRTALTSVIALFGLAMLLAALFAGGWARRIFQPIERMHATMNAVESGHPEARVGRVDRADEIGALARHLDELLARQEAQTADLKRWGSALDQEVARRTQELEQALSNLRAAQHKLVMNEKMAAIGQLTAGVAHEINNPIAVIQGNLEIAREVLGHQAAPVEPELRLILEQVHRIRLIVAKLLQFARPQEYVGYLEPVSADLLFHESLLLVGHLLKKSQIQIDKQLNSRRMAHGNKHELEQVIINLLVNAIQAMPDGGTLTLLSEDWDEADMPIGIRMAVADTGPGIAPPDQAKLFEPFFTAHKPGGNGLGLWVSKSLVERYDGRLTVENGPAGGACFSVWLRCDALN